MKNRKKTESLIINYIDKIAPGGDNKKLYQGFFKSMSDKKFDKFMHNLKDGKYTLQVIVPNTSNIKLDIERNFKLGKELGYDFFQHLIVENDRGMAPYKTPIKYGVISLPLRRAAQLLTKKISIPHGNTIDLSTGQVTNSAKGSKLTPPELQVLSGMSMDKSLAELMKIRGGDLGARNALSTLLYKQGSASQKVVEQYATGVESTKTLATLFKSSHIKPNNLTDNT